ncbi:DUF2480 family protein [Phaeocystidibacter luteus]|uniref:DUF2480 family protein n=1 Tax=Phaeocystidibacter luteus TaxID=911197 RepID=A0A6N6RHU6_9FLAO|nr:DUF2480 family protein [Phaeocystidibacter luteus]KAB2813958.1 DUF2480 family protein [Phaeocystidibacter luteus]
MADEIVNKIANSGLVNIDLEELYPKSKRHALDIAPWLYEGVMLREKDFRDHIKNHDWSQYNDAYVHVFCSEDAIIPQWAWILVARALNGRAIRTVYGDREALEALIFETVINQLDVDEYHGKKVIVKGCSNLPVPVQAYIKLTEKLTPVVQSLMYGEACSTVPIYKKPKD